MGKTWGVVVLYWQVGGWYLQSRVGQDLESHDIVGVRRNGWGIEAALALADFNSVIIDDTPTETCTAKLGL